MRTKAEIKDLIRKLQTERDNPKEVLPLDRKYKRMVINAEIRGLKFVLGSKSDWKWCQECRKLHGRLRCDICRGETDGLGE
jgi:hypothetical protein